MALSFSLTNALPRKSKSTTFDFGHYWKRSLATAVAARGLARMVRTPYDDEAFLCGLLARIGQLIMATTIGDRYATVLTKCQAKIPRTQVEREVLGFDFHQVGEALLRSWKLPEVLVRPVGGWQCDPARLANAEDGVSTLCKLLQTADSISALIYEDEKGAALAQVRKLAVQFFGLSEEEVDTFVLSLQEEVSHTASTLEVGDASNINQYSTILDEAREQMLQISLDAVTDLDEVQLRAATLMKENQELDVAAKTDQLTQLANRAYFDERLSQVIEARLRGNSTNALGILIMDVDHFKSFNDTHGHVVGDAVLEMVGRLLKAATRATDFIARYGGEEFAAILPNTTLADLGGVAERLRQTIEGEAIERDGKKLRVTISLGGACVNRVVSCDDGKALVELADQCLYEAKHAGRNRCVFREVQLVHA